METGETRLEAEETKFRMGGRLQETVGFWHGLQKPLASPLKQLALKSYQALPLQRKVTLLHKTG